MTYRLILLSAALPLFFYPGVLMAGIMTLAAEPNPHASIVCKVVAGAFIWSSLLYPIGYIAAVAISTKSSRVGAAVAVGHLLLCVSLFAAFVVTARG